MTVFDVNCGWLSSFIEFLSNDFLLPFWSRFDHVHVCVSVCWPKKVSVCCFKDVWYEPIDVHAVYWWVACFRTYGQRQVKSFYFDAYPFICIYFDILWLIFKSRLSVGRLDNLRYPLIKRLNDTWFFLV